MGSSSSYPDLYRSAYNGLELYGEMRNLSLLLSEKDLLVFISRNQGSIQRNFVSYSV